MSSFTVLEKGPGDDAKYDVAGLFASLADAMAPVFDSANRTKMMIVETDKESNALHVFCFSHDAGIASILHDGCSNCKWLS